MITVPYLSGTEAAHQMYPTDKRLAAAQHQAQVGREEVIGPDSRLVEGVAILQVDVQEGAVLSACHGPAVGQIAYAEGKREIDRQTHEVMVQRMIRPDPPCLSCHDAVECPYGVQNTGSQLAQKA